MCGNHPLPPQIDIFWLDWSRIVPTSPRPHLTTNGQIAHKFTQKFIRKNRNHQNSQAIYGFFRQKPGNIWELLFGRAPKNRWRNWVFSVFYIVYIYIYHVKNIPWISFSYKLNQKINMCPGALSPCGQLRGDCAESSSKGAEAPENHVDGVRAMENQHL